MSLAIVYTYYHLLMAVARRSSDGFSPEKILFVKDSAVPPKIERNLLQAIPGLKFINGRFGIPVSKARRKSIALARILAREAELSKVEKLYLGSDRPPEAQRLAASLSRGRRGVEVCALEDGIGIYSRGTRPESYLKSVLGKCVYGIGYRSLSVPGRSPYVSRLYLTRPDLVAWKPAEQVGDVKSAAGRLAEAFDFTFARGVDEGATLLLGPNPQNPRYPQLLKAMSEVATVEGQQVLMKKHPRDSSRWPIDLSIVELPQHLPAEMLAVIRPRIGRVLTTMSTPLYSLTAISERSVPTSLFATASEIADFPIEELNPLSEIHKVMG